MSSVYRHELDHAHRIAVLGHDVVFRVSTGTRRISDVLINGDAWELKSPTTGRAAGLVGAIRKAREQADSSHVDMSRSAMTRADVEAAIVLCVRRYGYRMRRTVVIEMDETGVDVTWERA